MCVCVCVFVCVYGYGLDNMRQEWEVADERDARSRLVCEVREVTGGHRGKRRCTGVAGMHVHTVSPHNAPLCIVYDARVLFTLLCIMFAAKN